MYLINTCYVIDSTANALAHDPLQTANVALLTESHESAKILLSKVTHPSSYILDCFTGVL